MPTQETQVYWYDVPTPKAPWRSPEELQRCIQESRELTAQATQRRWQIEHGTDLGAVRRRRRLPVLKTRTHLSTLARCRRAFAVKRLERPAMARGVVPEPDATPLGVVNLIMEHLHQRPVLHDEAAEVVENVAQHFTSLTQPSQRVPATQVDEAGQSGRRRSSRATAMESLLSQLQQDEGQSGPSASQATAGVSAALQDSLLLDALGAFCVARGLSYRRLTRAELRGMQYRVTGMEAVPHRRVVVLADRIDYSFVTFFGVERRTTPEPFVRGALERAHRTASSVQRYTKAADRRTQVFCMAPAPVPWRRITRSTSVAALRDEFVVAVIEVRDGSGADADGAEESAAQNVGPSRKRQRVIELLGADEESVTTAGSSRSRPRQSSGNDDWRDDDDTDIWPSPQAPSRPLRIADGAMAAGEPPLEIRWLSSRPLFTRASAATTTAPDASPLGSWGGTSDENTAASDPLLSLPRPEGAAHRRRSGKLAVWYRRLLRGDLANSLLRMQALDEREHEST